MKGVGAAAEARLEARAPLGVTRIDWVRQSLQHVRSSVIVYAIPEVLDTIKATLHTIGGDAALQSIRSGCFGHFLDHRAGEVQKKAIHTLMSRELELRSECRAACCSAEIHLPSSISREAHDREGDGGSVQDDGNGQRCSGLREGCEHIVRIPDDLFPTVYLTVMLVPHPTAIQQISIILQRSSDLSANTGARQ
ncbi:hypothetical protein C2S52_017183, partial [Perilla frutescens var. hirtella]